MKNTRIISPNHNFYKNLRKPNCLVYVFILFNLTVELNQTNRMKSFRNHISRISGIDDARLLCHTLLH